MAVDRPPCTILVCQNKACRKSGSKAVLAAFQNHKISEVPVIGSGCLGHCGNGPMVLVLPDEIWYRRVRAEEAIEIAKRWAIDS
ncbi:(2Fe-2S) ferredoxin domain-containing protein [Leptolyngbya sp. GB1-A1]|uniref:(2Fe-2S) ferredoxin domain-containing protein n=1 Tax=Leptolyngbya sp. GB1-A1 TaxID=2933908 RepID=UPI003298912C